MRLYTLFVFAIASILLSACASLPGQVVLPTPEASCHATLSWRGITPGKSTRQDVTDALGPPAETGTEQFDQRTVPFYAYRVDNGTIAQYVQDRIFFRSDGVVDWLEVIVADRDGKYHPIRDMLNELGSTLDTIYWNNNYRPNSHQFDVLGGPDQVWIWSECGVALNTTGHCSPAQEADPLCPRHNEPMAATASTPTTLTLRYPHVQPEAAQVPDPSVDNTVLMMFLFPPTSYKGFSEYYMQKIPFRLWNDFLDKIYHGD